MGIAARIITHVAAQCYRARPTGDVRRRSALSTQGDLAKGLRKHPRDVVETSPRRRANRKRRAVHAQGISGTLVDRAGVEVHGCSSHQPAGGRTQREGPGTILGDRARPTSVTQCAQGERSETLAVVGGIKDRVAKKGSGTQREAVGGAGIEVGASHHGQGVPIANRQRAHGVPGDRAGGVDAVDRNGGAAGHGVEPRGERGVRVIPQFQTPSGKGHGAGVCSQRPGYRGDRRTFVQGKASRIGRARAREQERPRTRLKNRTSPRHGQYRRHRQIDHRSAIANREVLQGATDIEQTGDRGPVRVVARIISQIAGQCHRARPGRNVRRRSSIPTQGDRAKRLTDGCREVVEASPIRGPDRKARAVHPQGTGGTLIDRARVEVHRRLADQAARGRIQRQRPRAPLGDRARPATVTQRAESESIGVVKDGITRERGRGGGNRVGSLSRQRVAADAQGAQGEDDIGGVQRGIAGDRRRTKGQGRRGAVAHLGGSKGHRANAQRTHRLGEGRADGGPIQNQTATLIGQVATKVRRRTSE